MPTPFGRPEIRNIGPRNRDFEGQVQLLAYFRILFEPDPEALEHSVEGVTYAITGLRRVIDLEIEIK